MSTVVADETANELACGVNHVEAPKGSKEAKRKVHKGETLFFRTFYIGNETLIHQHLQRIKGCPMCSLNLAIKTTASTVRTSLRDA